MIFGEFNNSREIEVAKAIRIQINIYTNKQARYIYIYINVQKFVFNIYYGIMNEYL